VDFGKGKLEPFPALMEEIIELVAQDAEEFDVRDEVAHARTIISEGTSADRQMEAYRAAISGGASEAEALQAVVDELIVDTLYGIEA
jgi:carboxylate-amine ligase